MDKLHFGKCENLFFFEEEILQCCKWDIFSDLKTLWFCLKKFEFLRQKWAKCTLENPEKSIYFWSCKVRLFEWFWNTVRVQGCCIDYSEFLMQWKSSVCGLVKRAGMEPCLPVPEDAILFDVTNAENHSLASTHQCNFLETWWEFRRIRTLSRITQHYQ